MIRVTRMDRQEMHLNPDLIVSIESTPDTVITLFNGHHFIIREPAGVIIDRIATWRTRIVRRSAPRSGKKYLERKRRELFRSTTLNREITLPESLSSHERSPLHSRDV